jgi:hypothetical protein
MAAIIAGPLKIAGNLGAAAAHDNYFADITAAQNAKLTFTCSFRSKADYIFIPRFSAVCIRAWRVTKIYLIAGP